MYDNTRTIIQEGFALLKRSRNYKQVIVVSKLKSLNFSISKASFCNILNGKKAGADALWNAAQGIRELVALELGLHWDGNRFAGKVDSSWTATVVAPLSEQEPSVVLKPGFAFHEDGRISIAGKVDFFSTAQKEVIEFGVTLNTFAAYFFSRNDREFKSPVEALLQRGVNFKCYLLDPDCSEAMAYFNDRKKEQADEAKSLDKIKETIRKLGRIQQEFQQAGHPGAFEVFVYRHIPYNYFMAVDSNTPHGKMMISPYIYGESRANCPVIAFSRKDNSLLYKKYNASLQALTKGAKSVLFAE